METKLENLQWQCAECKATAPPTAYDYMKLLKHQKGHHISLVNTATGEVLAVSLKEAVSKGIEIPRKTGAAPGGMELTEEGLMLAVTFPPILLTLFDVAKAAELVEEEQDLDTWLYECVQKRFELDYHRKLMLVPTEDKK